MFCFVPVCRIVEVQIDAPQVRLPAGRKRKLRIRGGKLRGRLILGRGVRNFARDEVRAVRVDKRHAVEHRIAVERAGRFAAEAAVFADGAAVSKQQLPEKCARDRLVGVVRAAEQDLVAAAAELNGNDGSSACRARERFDIGKGRSAPQLPEIPVLTPGGQIAGRQDTAHENRLRHKLWRRRYV